MESGKGVSLDAISQSTKLNKGTLCNILKTMIALGYIEKCGVGSYQISSKFVALARPFYRNETIVELSNRFAHLLSEQTKESGVVSTLRMDKVHILAQAQHQRQVMINFSYYKDLSLYHSVSGRVLLAYLNNTRLEEITKSVGLPGKEWDNANTLEDLKKAINTIRDAGMSIMRNPVHEITSYAMPIIDGAGEICAALGLTVPVFRLGNDNESKIINSLRTNSREMSNAVASQCLGQSDFIF
jgi:DNA-binding IclR family transcriptional regulator